MKAGYILASAYEDDTTMQYRDAKRSGGELVTQTCNSPVLRSTRSEHSSCRHKPDMKIHIIIPFYFLLQQRDAE